MVRPDRKFRRRRDSPEIENKKTFFFSRRNFYPRQNYFNTTIERKFNPFDYFSNNYYPTRISPRKNQISLDYYNLAENTSKEFLKKTNSCFTSSKTLNFNKFEEEKINFNFNENTFFAAPGHFLHKNEDLSTKSTSPNSSELGFVKRHNSEHTHMPNRKNSSNNSIHTLEDNKNEFVKKSHFVERQGDWICTRCKNLNFSFRIVCNRCKISKAESEVLYEGNHMQNIFNLLKYNELIHTQILLAQQGALNMNSPAFYPPKTIEN